MDIKTFRRIVTAFADDSVDVDIGKGTMVAQIRDELVEVSIFEKEGTIWVREAEDAESAYHWIIRRLARLHLLADHLLARIPKEEYYVDPEGTFLDDFAADPGERTSVITDAATGIEESLRESIAGVTRVLYLTSDAGEGKTTLINQVALDLAHKFKRRESSRLVLEVDHSWRLTILSSRS